MSITRTQTCYDCDAVLQNAEAARKHVCTPLRKPADGTSFTLETYGSSGGLVGSYSVDIVKDGKTVAGMISGRKACENLLRIRGFKGPFVWPTVAESDEARAARRAAWKAARRSRA